MKWYPLDEWHTASYTEGNINIIKGIITGQLGSQIRPDQDSSGARSGQLGSQIRQDQDSSGARSGQQRSQIRQLRTQIRPRSGPDLGLIWSQEIRPGDQVRRPICAQIWSHWHQICSYQVFAQIIEQSVQKKKKSSELRGLELFFKIFFYTNCSIICAKKQIWTDLVSIWPDLGAYRPSDLESSWWMPAWPHPASFQVATSWLPSLPAWRG